MVNIKLSQLLYKFPVVIYSLFSILELSYRFETWYMIILLTFERNSEYLLFKKQHLMLSSFSVDFWNIKHSLFKVFQGRLNDIFIQTS